MRGPGIEDKRGVDLRSDTGTYSGLVKGVAKAPDIADDDLNVMMNTNVIGLINMTQTILHIFQKRRDGGQGDIINIGSVAGRDPYQGGSIYCATKAAVRSFTESLRKELIASRIRVIEIDPGQVETVRLQSCRFRVKLLVLIRENRSFHLYGSMATGRRPMRYTSKSCSSIARKQVDF